MKKYYLAVDLKIDSGEFLLGACSSGRINTVSIGSFPISPINENGALVWDIEAIFEEVKKGICRAQRMVGSSLVSVGITSWGNDFGLLGEDGVLLQKPLCYEDQDNSSLVESVTERIPPVRMYSVTASNNSDISSLYQLLALKKKHKDILDRAHTFLMIPDILNYWLTGVAVSDQTMASTTQLYNPTTKTWAESLMESLELPVRIFPELKPAGTNLGPVKAELATELGISSELNVILPGCHDTACALACIPDDGGNFAYLCAESWSILGSVIKRPVVSHNAMTGHFSNECGVGGTINLLSVMRGQWALEQCRDVWAKEDGRKYSWEEIADLALEGEPFRSVIDLRDARFSVIGDMPEILRNYCEATGQKIPANRSDCLRILMEGLALNYRRVIGQLERLTGQRIFCLYVVGKAALNSTMNMLIANALNRRVIAGSDKPISVGNLMVQMIHDGAISTLSEGRKIVKESVLNLIYDPAGQEGWDEAAQKLELLTSGK